MESTEKLTLITFHSYWVTQGLILLQESQLFLKNSYPLPSASIHPYLATSIDMKRAADEAPSADQQRKRPGPSPSNPPTNGYPHPPFSPASVASPSPQHQQTHTGNFKKFIGCSKFEDYELEIKLGEGTFG